MFYLLPNEWTQYVCLSVEYHIIYLFRFLFHYFPIFLESYVPDVLPQKWTVQKLLGHWINLIQFMFEHEQK